MMKKMLGLILGASTLLSFAPVAMADGEQCMTYITCDRGGSCHDVVQVCPGDDQIIHAD